MSSEKMEKYKFVQEIDLYGFFQETLELVQLYPTACKRSLKHQLKFNFLKAHCICNIWKFSPISKDSYY